MKLWEGMLSGKIDKIAEAYNSSIKIDKRMVISDIVCSIAHVKMLAEQNILSVDEAVQIVKALEEIKIDIQDARLIISDEFEDIHTFIEYTLIQKIGKLGGKMHTARSRNDQVVTDFRHYLIQELSNLMLELKNLIKEIVTLAKSHTKTIMPGLTHLQAAQPISFAYHLMSWAFSLRRDYKRIENAIANMNECPLGACALAGTSFDIDRAKTSSLLGFTKPMENAMDAVSARDFVLESLSSLAILASTYSRIAEEIILWSSQPFGYIRLSQEFSTGSSIMPQKINPDPAELLRGKTGRVYGSLMQALTMVKGLSLAYSKDLQEDKESVFDALDTSLSSTLVLRGMIATLSVNKANMLKNTNLGYMQATDIADYLAKKGLPFRDSHHISAKIVKYAMDKEKYLCDLSLDEYRGFSDIFENDIFKVIDLENIVMSRNSYGGTSEQAVLEQIRILDNWLN